MLQNEIFIPESIKLCLSKRFFSAPSMSSCFTMPSLVVVMVVVDGGGDCCGDASYSCVVGLLESVFLFYFNRLSKFEFLCVKV